MCATCGRRSCLRLSTGCCTSRLVATELLHNGADPTVAEGRTLRSRLTPLEVAQNLPQVFSWSLKVCPEIARLLKRAMRWTPQSYPLHPARFRRGVRHVYGLKVHLEQSLALPMLSAVVWQIIVAELPRSWGLGV